MVDEPTVEQLVRQPREKGIKLSVRAGRRKTMLPPQEQWTRRPPGRSDPNSSPEVLVTNVPSN